MIGPAEVRQWAESLWSDYLRAVLDGKEFFPQRRDRLGRVPASEDPAQFAEAVAPLWNGSKQMRGTGYTVVLEEKQRRKRALQNEPVAVVFETEDDYLSLLERREAAAAFKQDIGVILNEFPQVKDALRLNPTVVVANQGSWLGVLEVVRYLASHPRPGCFVRALPVGVATKFIESHREAIEKLLVALPESGYQATALTFAERCGFSEDEPAIRGRFLCSELQTRCGFAVPDVTLRIGAWARLPLPAEMQVVACENKTNFLALPPMRRVLALWGEGGAATGHFPKLPWLRERNVVYWGDLDPCGFAILAYLRDSLPTVRTILMDEGTLRAHVDKLREAKASPGSIAFDRLKPEEASAARKVAGSLKGIEQEKLLFQDCVRLLQTAFL